MKAERLAICFAVVINATAAWSQGLMSGVYEGLGQDRGSLRVIVDGRDVGVTIKAVGCLGSVEGFLATNDAGDLFMV